MSNLKPLKLNKIPEALPLKKLIGPSFIILGMGLGSGELILWPYLTSNFGLGIIWAALLGITLQFFINMEIERYTLATGESIFVGLTRRFGKLAPYWFIISTLVPWIWPGIIASSAKLFSEAIGISYSKYIAIAFITFLVAFYSFGKVVYKTQERIQKTIILIGIPFIFLITFYLTKLEDFIQLAKGIVGIGEGFFLLPVGLPIATFLAALAYAGAGGNLNLAQSLYVKEKGYGMAKYSGKITNILLTKSEKVNLEGQTFELTPKNINTFKTWWEKINIEHAIVFWATGAFSMLLLSLLAYSTVYKLPGVETSINFITKEAGIISSLTFPFLGKIFLFMASIMLFGTQFSVYGSNARIISESIAIIKSGKFSPQDTSKLFYIFLWFQILAGVLIFALGFTEPLSLVVTGAVLNAISMFFYSGMILLTNLTILAKPLQPSGLRIFAVFLAFLFYGVFSIFTLSQGLKNLFNN